MSRFIEGGNNPNPNELMGFDALPRTTKGKVRWTLLKRDPDGFSSIVEAEAVRLVTSGEVLSRSNLNKTGRRDLAHAIDIYPGGFTALRSKLDQPEPQKPHGYWKNPEVIEKHLKQAIASGVEPTLSQLAKAGMSTLAAAIREYYPGGWSELKNKFNIQDKVRPMGYWTPERIEEALF